MKLRYSPSCFVSASLFVLVAVFTLPSQALVVGALHPADAFDNLNTLTDPSYVSLNPGLTPIVSNEGYSHTNSIEVDASTGSIKGYAGYKLNSAGQVTRTGNLIKTIAGSTEEALLANSSGSVIYTNATVGTAPVGSGSGTVGNGFATISLVVDGSFNYTVGTPTLGLVGAVSVTVNPGGNVLNSTSYVVGGRMTNFDTQVMLPVAGSVFTREDLQVFDAFGNAILNPTIPGITYGANFVSTNPSALSMIVSLMVPIQQGDTITIGGSAGGGATHAFLEDFRNVSIGAMGNVDAAEGYVDFLNTAQLGIELAPGYTLTGADAPPLNIITTSPVPVPGAVWLFSSALLTLVGLARKDRVKTENKIF